LSVDVKVRPYVRCTYGVFPDNARIARVRYFAVR